MRDNISIEIDSFPFFRGLFYSSEYNARLVYKIAYRSLGDFKGDKIEYKKGHYIITIDSKWNQLGVNSYNFIDTLTYLLTIKSPSSVFLKLVYKISNNSDKFIEYLSFNKFIIESPIDILGFREYLLNSYFIVPINGNKEILSKKYNIVHFKGRKKIFLCCVHGKSQITFIVNSDAKNSYHLLKKKIIDITTSTNISQNIFTNYIPNYEESNLIYYLDTTSKELKDFFISIRQMIQYKYQKNFNILVPTSSFIITNNMTKKNLKFNDDLVQKIKESFKYIIISYSKYQHNIEIVETIKVICNSIGIRYQLNEYSDLKELEKIKNQKSNEIILKVTYKDFPHYSSMLLQLLNKISDSNKAIKYWLNNDILELEDYINNSINYIPIFQGEQLYYKNNSAKYWRYNKNGYLQKS